MRKILAVSIILITACVWSAAADSSPPVAVLRITSGTEADLAPVIGVNSRGRVFVAWKRYAADRSSAQLCLAQSPDWSIASVAAISPRLNDTQIALAVGERVQLAWSQPATLTQLIFQYAPEIQTKPQVWERPMRENATWAVDNMGRLHDVWLRENIVYYTGSRRDITITIPITSSETVADLSLDTDVHGIPHLAWSNRDLTGREAGIYYAPLVSGTIPLQIAASGVSPRLMLFPSGRAHIAWLTDKGLWYAHSSNWAKPTLVLTDTLKPGAFASAVSAHDIVHLVWASNKAIWYANSADWECTRVLISAPVGEVSTLGITTDGHGLPHIVWSAADEKGNFDLYYARLGRIEPQLSVAFPLGGETLTRDVSVQATSNLFAHELLRVEFYLQSEEARLSNGRLLLSLGVDRDGSDGWSVPLRLADLDSRLRYRVVALGTDLQGRIVQASGDWFTIQPRETPWVWLQPHTSEPSRATTYERVLAGAGARLQRLDLFLIPHGCGIANDLEEEDCFIVSNAIYVGSYDLSSDQERDALQWRRLAYDSRSVPDGNYRAFVVATDRLGRRGYGVSPEPFRIDNAILPSVQISLPISGAVIEDILEVSVRANDLNGVIKRIDFYLQRMHPLACSPYDSTDCPFEIPEILLLGSDSDGSDGWGIRWPVNSNLEGQEWSICAVVFDDQGLSSSACSDKPLTIIGNRGLYWRLLSPLPNSTLRGVEMLRLSVEKNAHVLSHVQVYVTDLSGTMSYLGLMTQSGNRWTYEWNTVGWPDGNYALVIIGQHEDGNKSILRCDGLSIQNGLSPHAFKGIVPGAVLTETAVLQIQRLGDLPTKDISFYFRDAYGELRPIGQAVPKGDIWRVVWDTTTVLDGSYELVAMISGAHGHTSLITTTVEVRNKMPSIVFQGFPDDAILRGTRQIAWRIEPAPKRPMSLTIEYSPDAGNHWVEISSFTVTSPTASFGWNTAAYPDSAHAVLRLALADGPRRGRAISKPFAVNNVNESPQIALLAPRSGSVHGGSVYIAWQAQDPDSDELLIDLEYRQGNRPWMPLARRVPNVGHYLWPTRGLPAAKDYELRITAIDPSGATSTDSVRGIHLVSNTPPVVSVLWPKGDVRLQRETAILWQATDEDRDELSIDLYYSDNAGQTWLPIAERLPNTGYYVWQVSYLPMGTQYRVRVVARDGFFRTSAESDQCFAIGANTPPQVALLLPAPGSNVSGIQMVRWSALDPDRRPLTVTLLLRTIHPDRADWMPLVADIPDNGFYLWDTSRHPDGDYELHIIVSDGQYSATATLSRAVTISNRKNHAPYVVLLSPRGGELWSGLQEIAWRAWDQENEPITTTLYLSTDGGEQWSVLASLDARTLRYVWDTRQIQSGRACLARIVVSDSLATSQDISSSAFYVTNRQSYPPHVRFISPDPSGKLLHGNTISWMAEDPDDDILRVALEISEDDGMTWRKLGDDLLSMGSYQLDTAALKAELAYRLRLRVSDGTYSVQTLSVPFELKRAGAQPPSLRILAPSGGERWTGKREVRWQAADPSGQSMRVDIDLSRDGGRNWISIVNGQRDTGSYTLDTTLLPNGIYLLRVTIDNGQIKSAQVSDAFFIENAGRNAPVVSIINPHGNIWWGAREVRWHAVDADADLLSLSLDYSIDMGRTWRAFAYAIPNTGSYVWDTTMVPNCDRLWLRATVTDGRFTASDVSEHPIAMRNLNAPMVKLLMPRGGEVWAGTQRIVWFTTQRLGRPVRVALEISQDAGQTWQTLASNLPSQGTFTWDTAQFPENSQVLIRATALDGLRIALDSPPRPITVRGNKARSSLLFYLP